MVGRLLNQKLECPLILTSISSVEDMPESQEGLLNQDKKTYKSRAQITLMALNISLSSFYFGYCIVYFGQVKIEAIKEIFAFDVDLSIAKGLLNGCIPVGALFGALSSSILLAKFSRRNCVLLINFCAIVVGGFVFIQNFYSLLFFRLCQGFLVGVYSSLSPLIIKELSPIEISGTLGSYTQLFVTFGVFFGCFLAYVLRKITGDQTGKDFWYILFGFPEITLIIQTLILLFVYPYETPKYLLLNKRDEEARKLVELIYKEEYVDQIIEQKKSDIEASDNTIISEDEVVAQKINKIPIIVAIHLAALQQLSGIDALAVYGGDIAANACKGELSLLMPSLINFEQVIGCFSTGILLTKFGRKSIMQVGTILEGFADILVAVGFFIKSGSDYSSFGQALVLIGLFLYMGVFGVSLGPVVWLYIPEIVQPKIVPFSTAVNWICASLVIILFPILTDSILDNNPGVLFLFFGIWCVGSFIFNMKYLIETKDKSQKVIQEEYSKFA